jgi:hypothetical protein
MDLERYEFWGMRVCVTDAAVSMTARGVHLVHCNKR